MITSPVLHQTHFFTSTEDLKSQNPELDTKLKEQETLLKKCNTIDEFKQVHGQVIKCGTTFFSTTNLLSTCCALSTSMDYALSIFRQTEEPGTFEYNTMIRNHVKEFSFEKALCMYYEMVERCYEVPNKFTYPPLLKACAWLNGLEEGVQIHGQIVKNGFEFDVYVQNSLIYMYGKCDEIELSCSVFDQIDVKGVAQWSAIIASHASLGKWRDCLRLFREMGFGRCFCRPEESVLVSVLSSCTHLNALDLGRCTHGYLLKNIDELNVVVQTSLIDMYVKCGCLEKGLFVFRKMAKKNKLSYSVMISGLAMYGNGEEALKVFDEMVEKGLKPDRVVYVSVLSACSRAGLVEQGFKCFDRMRFEDRIEPGVEHYSCLVDLMGKAGLVEKAFEFVKNMPVDPNDVVWRCLLNACRLHRNVEVGENVGKALLKLRLSSRGDYLVLASMYARANRWTDVANVWSEMLVEGKNVIDQASLSSSPGFSVVEVGRKMYKFVSRDKSHPQCERIYKMIHQMEWQLKFEGYVPDLSVVPMMMDEDENEDEKRERLKSHSQKLAIAFALISTSSSVIRITRNVKMCSDCHVYTKLISVVYGREIIVRDRSRFHCFKNGTCSCRDYW